MSRTTISGLFMVFVFPIALFASNFCDPVTSSPVQRQAAVVNGKQISGPVCKRLAVITKPKTKHRR